MAQTIPRQRLRRLAPSIGILSALCLTAYLATSAPTLRADASPAPPHSYVPTGTWEETLDPAVVSAMDQVAYQYNLPRWWIYAVVAKESSFDPEAINDWDIYAGTGYEGSGLTQLTTEKYVGWPYPMDLNTCNNNHPDWRTDMGLNKPYLGDWIDMCQVSVLGWNERFDPYKNLERFATVHAVPFYQFLKSKHPEASIYELLRRVAYHWNRGLPYFGDSYNPNNWSYLTGPYGYDHWVSKYRWPVEAEDGVWDGAPSFSPNLSQESYWIYGDQLAWSNWSWDTVVDPDVSYPAFAEARSMGVTLSSAWAGLLLHHSALDTSPYSHLNFAILPNGSALPDINVSLYDTSDELNKVHIQSYASYIVDGWYRISIPLTHLGGADTTITQVQLQDASGQAQPTFHLDNLRFIP